MTCFGLGRAAVAAGVVLAIAVGCGTKEDDTPKGGNGVDDVKAACEIRAKWTRSGTDCSLCLAAAVSPRCDCTALAAFGAACLDQQNARKAVCNDAIDLCVNNCNASDCACIEGCYAGADACKKASAARDGCVAEVCDSHCK